MSPADSKASLDGLLDDLYAVRLQDFVKERKRIADSLKAAGRRDDAKSVEKLQRPPVPAWAVNQIARRAPKLVNQLGRLTDALQGAQARIAKGGDAGPDYASATAAHRQLLLDLRTEAEAVLKEGAHAATPQLLSRIVANLRAGAANAEARAMIEAGRLSQEIGAADFASLFEQTPGGAAGKAESKAELRQAARQQQHKEAAVREETKSRVEARARIEKETQQRLKALQSASAAAQRTLEKEERARAAAKRALVESEERWEAARMKAQLAARELIAAEEDAARQRKA